MTEPPDKLNDYSLPAEFDVVSYKSAILGESASYKLYPLNYRRGNSPSEY